MHFDSISFSPFNKVYSGLHLLQTYLLSFSVNSRQVSKCENASFKGKQIFLSEYQKKLETTIKHPTLNKKVSYKYLIRLEGYKLIKHLLNDKKYESFKMWW